MKLGVLVSGTGSNLQAIIDAISEGRLAAEIAVVISNRPGVLALERATRANIPAVCVDHKRCASREEFDEQVVSELDARGVEWVVLAGFMRLITPYFLSRFPDRVINIHPALLPAFPGVRGIEQALDYGVKVTGCTVHLVDEGTDTGPILAQKMVEVRDDDTLETLSERMHRAEHALFVDTLARISKTPPVVSRGSSGRARIRFGSN
jgi:phosphoribosylglycinamide formyltransferase-1